MAEQKVPSFFLCANRGLETETFENLFSGLIFGGFNIVVNDIGAICFNNAAVERQGQNNLRGLCG